MDGIKVKGMFRVRITEPGGEIVGDSGWRENVVTNLGFNEYLVSTLGAVAGSKVVGYVALGEGTEPGAADTSLQSEVVKRTALTAATTTGSKTLRCTATFASVGSFVTDTVSLKNIALVSNLNSTDAFTIFCGNTYDTSTCATNQAVNVTYDVIFS